MAELSGLSREENEKDKEGMQSREALDPLDLHDTQMALRGGFRATPVSSMRKSCRNYFAPQAPWQFSGIRFSLGGDTS